MARARNIKPGFFLNDELAECEPLARLLFAGLWCIADREGRLEDKPKRIKVETLPYDDCDIDLLLNSLVNKQFIARYEAKGEKYIQILNFKKHQNPHVKEAPSIIPALPKEILAPEKHSASTVQEQEKPTTNPADSLLLIPDSLKLIPESEEATSSELSVDNVDIVDNSFKTVWNEYLNNINPSASQFESEAIDKWLETFTDPLILIKAIHEAVANNARTLKYIEAVLVAWDGAGLKTIEAVEAHLNNRKKIKPTEKSEKTNQSYGGQRQYDINELEKQLLGKGT